MSTHKRMTFDITYETHMKLKTIAAKKGLSMRDIIQRLIDGFIETMELTNEKN